MPKKSLKLLRKFLESPRRTGTIAPTSPRLAQALCARALDQLRRREEESSHERVFRIVELGPGTGPITQAIHRQFHRFPFQYLGIELNSGFLADLRKDFPDYEFWEGSASELRALGLELRSVDAFVSSLPWSILGDRLVYEILRECAHTLDASGSLSTFVYVHTMGLPSVMFFVDTLRRFFHEVELSHVEWRNIPPAIVIRANRPRISAFE